MRVMSTQDTPWEIYKPSTTVVTDDDYVPPTISISDASALETDGTISFTVSLDRANTEQAATVDWATAEDGSTTAATSGVDYTAASGALSFAIGETEKTITVALLDDHSDEDDETFNVVLSNPSEVTIGDGTGSGTIDDNELAFGVLMYCVHVPHRGGRRHSNYVPAPGAPGPGRCRHHRGRLLLELSAVLLQ